MSNNKNVRQPKNGRKQNESLKHSDGSFHKRSQIKETRQALSPSRIADSRRPGGNNGNSDKGDDK